MVVHKYISQPVWTVPEIDMLYIIFIQVDTFNMVSDPAIHTTDFIAEWLHFFSGMFYAHHPTKSAYTKHKEYKLVTSWYKTFNSNIVR